MSISEKIKAINNKIKQNKDQYNLDKKLLRFMIYHQETLVKFLTSKVVLPEKRLVRQAAAIKRFQYLNISK